MEQIIESGMSGQGSLDGRIEQVLSQARQARTVWVRGEVRRAARAVTALAAVPDTAIPAGAGRA